MKHMKRHFVTYILIFVGLSAIVAAGCEIKQYYDRHYRIMNKEYLNSDFTEVINGQNKHGLIDSQTEKQVVDFKYDDISSIMSNQVVRVEIDGKSGLLSLISYKLIVPAEYNIIHRFDNNTGLCCALKNDSLFFFNEAGKRKPYSFPLNGTDPDNFNGFDQYRLCVVPITKGNTTFLALIDTNGKTITKAPYNNIETHPYFFDESGKYLGYYSVETPDGFWGVIDSNGANVVNPEFIFVDLIEQLGIVVATDSSQYLLGFDGKPKTLQVYDEVGEVFEDPYFAVWINGNQGIMDIYGNVIINPRWDEVIVLNAGTGLFCATKNDYKVLLDKNDNFVDAPE